MSATRTPFFQNKPRVWLLAAILLIIAVLAVIIPQFRSLSITTCREKY